MKAYARMLYVYSIMAVCAGGLITLPLAFFQLLLPDKKFSLLIVWYFSMLFLWVFLIIGYAVSWCLWTNFLKSVPSDLYCIDASSYIDVVYCLLPVLLGTWRLACAAHR